MEGCVIGAMFNDDCYDENYADVNYADENYADVNYADTDENYDVLHSWVLAQSMEYQLILRIYFYQLFLCNLPAYPMVGKNLYQGIVT